MLLRMTDSLHSDFKITFGIGHETGSSDHHLDSLVGLSPADLDNFSAGTGTSLSTRPGSVGVGAAGPGVELILTFASIPGDFVSFVAIGQMIRSVVKQIQSRRQRPITVSDPNTMSALAAASVKTDLHDQLKGTRLKSVRNLFGGEPPNWLGTDTRDIWAVTFEHETEGYTFIIFMSSSGLVLGQAEIPLESYWDGTKYQQRTPEDVARWHSKLGYPEV